MNSKSLPIIIGLVLVIVVGGFVYMQSSAGNAVPATTSDTTQTGTSTSSTQTTGQTYTMAEIATHKDATSCWTTINGDVYDVTNWISQHPGGQEAILSLCGTDGSAAFNGQHGGQRRPASELATFKIGTLAQ